MPSITIPSNDSSFINLYAIFITSTKSPNIGLSPYSLSRSYETLLSIILYLLFPSSFLHTYQDVLILILNLIIMPPNFSSGFLFLLSPVARIPISHLTGGVLIPSILPRLHRCLPQLYPFRLGQRLFSPTSTGSGLGRFGHGGVGVGGAVTEGVRAVFAVRPAGTFEAAAISPILLRPAH